MTVENTPRKRTVVMTDDTKQNVKSVATYRLNNAAKSIATFGQCFGGRYEWTTEQIEIAETALLQAVDSALDNIKTGKRIAAAGIVL